MIEPSHNNKLEPRFCQCDPYFAVGDRRDALPRRRPAAASRRGVGRHRTVTGLIDAIKTHQNAVNTGVVVLDRVLLILIVAELLHTLRFVVLRGQIAVEPFLFVGLIAVVRRILIITAELECQIPAGRALTNLLLELGLLRFLTLALAAAIYMVRRGGSEEAGQAKPPEIDSPATLPV